MSAWNEVQSSWLMIQRHKNTIAFHAEKILTKAPFHFAADVVPL